MKTLNIISTVVLSISTFFVSAQNNWRNIGPGGGSDLHFLAIQPDNKNVIYAGGDIEGIFKTTDGGTTWRNINNNIAQQTFGANYWINDIQIDPVDFQKVYICMAHGLFRSTNGGQYWQRIFPDTIDNVSNPPIMTSAIAIDSANTNRLFLGLGDETADCSFADFLPFTGYKDGEWGVYRSLDGGTTWTLSSTGLPDSLSIHSIEVIPNTDTVILASTYGVFRSDDGGTTWTAKNIGLPHTNCHQLKSSNDFGSLILTLSLKTIGETNDSTTFKGGIFRSYDWGDTWIDITGNLPKYDAYSSLFYDYWKFDINPLDVSTIYTATNRGSGFNETGVFATYDEGVTWDLLYTPLIGGWIDTAWFWDGYAYDIKFAPSDPSRLVISLIDIEISNDTGYTWNQVFTSQIGSGWKGNGLELMNTEGIAFDPNNANRAYIGYDDMGLFISDDACTSFIRLDSHQDPTIGTLSDIDAAKDIYFDPSNGDIYVERFQGSQGGYNAGWSGGGIVFSNDMGVTFSNITGSMPVGRHDIAVDFNSGSAGNRTIYSALYLYNVYKSTDGGTTWNPINTGLATSSQYAWDIVINPNNNLELYLACNSWGQGSGGLFKSSDGGSTWIQLTGLIAGDVSKVFVNNLNDIYVGVSDNFDWNTSGGLYRSTDGGTIFTEILDHSRVVDVQTNPSNPDYIVAVAQQWYNITTEQHGIYLSDDNGISWSLISQNVNHTFFNFARFNPYTPKQLYAGTGGGGLWVNDSIADITVGQNELVANKSTNIINYPNPSTGKIIIEMEKEKGKKENGVIEIFNMLGEKIYQSEIKNPKSEITLNLPNGMYFYQIIDNKQFITSGKLILQ